MIIYNDANVWCLSLFYCSQIDLDFNPPGEAMTSTTEVNVADGSDSSRRLRAAPGRGTKDKPESLHYQQRHLQSTPQVL